MEIVFGRGFDPSPSPSATTNVGGTFEIRGMPGSAVVASHPEFAPALVQIPQTWPPILHQIRLTLTPGARIEGVALQKHGTPLVGVGVQVKLQGANEWPPMRTMTRDDGSFSLDHVPPGPAPYVEIMDSRGKVSFMTGWFPQQTLIEGETARVEFGRYFVRVRGLVSRSSVPLAGAALRRVQKSTSNVEPHPQPGEDIGPVVEVSDEEGFYELLLQPGPLPLMIESAGKRRLGPYTLLVPDADDPRVDIALAAGETVSGRVIDKATSKGLAGAVLDIRRRSDKSAPRALLRTIAGGRFSLDLEPDDYVFNATAWGYQPLRVEAGVQPDLVLEMLRAPQVSGRVLPCDEVVSVLVFSTDGRDQSVAQIDDDCRFRTDGLADKTYTLLAGSERTGWALQPGVPAGAEGVTLNIVPPGRVVLTILDPQGRPLAAALAIVRTVAGAPVVVSHESGVRATDAKGHVDFPVPAGEVGIDVLSQRYKARLELQVDPGATVTRQITLTEPSGLPR